MGSVIVGSGVSVPDRVVTNHDLAGIMDTSDEWIRRRTGVVERRFVEPGVGSSDLGAAAARQALADAGHRAGDVDLLITATMTPDFQAPGIAALVQHQAGLGPVPAFDIRQQCAGFLYALDMADARLSSGRADTALVVGAEVHAGFQPWGRTWDYLLGESPEPPTEEEWVRNTDTRDWSVLFGDGAGAMLLRRDERPEHGFLGFTLGSDGSHFDLIHVPGAGFRNRPYIDQRQLDAQLHLPTMKGRELFRLAVRRMPEAIEQLVEVLGLSVADVDLVVAHQANARIVRAVGERLGLAPERVPTNIESYGNTTSATLPLLYHELRAAGRIGAGALVAFTVFGAGAHWGAALYREPG